MKIDTARITPRSPTCHKIMRLLIDIRIFSLTNNYTLKLAPLEIAQALNINDNTVRKYIRYMLTEKFVTRETNYTLYTVSKQNISKFMDAQERRFPLPKPKLTTQSYRELKCT